MTHAKRLRLLVNRKPNITKLAAARELGISSKSIDRVALDAGVKFPDRRRSGVDGVPLPEIRIGK